MRLDVSVRYQACTDSACLAPRTQALRLEIPIAPVEVGSGALREGLERRAAGVSDVPVVAAES